MRSLAVTIAVFMSILGLAACGSGGSQPSSDPVPQGDGQAVTCDWLVNTSCWKDAVAAALACTDPAAVGTFDAAQTTCTYGDGTVVHVSPAAVPAIVHQSQNEVAVITATGATCARFFDSASGRSLTTRLGTFTADRRSMPFVYTCPDGTRFHVEGRACQLWEMPLSEEWTFGQDGLVTFGLHGIAHGDVWKCKGAPLAP